MLVDVHAHLDLVKDIGSTVNICKEKNFDSIITNGTNLEDNKKVLELSFKYDIIKPALGLYPLDLEKLNQKQIDDFFIFLESKIKNIFAIGEVGLDFSKENFNKEKQIKYFKKFLSLSEKYNKPLIIHSRKAEEQIVDIITSSSNKKIIMHCFCGNFKLIKKLIEHGVYFSIPCTILKSKHFQKLVEVLPFENILTESDSPFLSSNKLLENKPYFIVDTIKKISEIKKINKTNLENKIFTNYKKIFLHGKV